jgi:subtilisin family serine protease
VIKKILFFVFLSTVIFSQVEVSTRLQHALQNAKADEYVYGFIYLKDQVDINSLDARLYKEKATLQQRAYEVITTLQQKANETQQPFIEQFELKTESGEIFSYQRFWIANMFSVIAKPSFFYEMMTRQDVAQMDLDAELLLDAPVKGTATELGTESVEPGVKIINAHKLWELGITGQGRLVMGIDTGVDYNHPQLNSRWRGQHVPTNQAWFDPSGSTTPSDCDNHGTHTMGTMVGRITGDTIGIAIDAEWIAAKTICSSPHTSNSIAAFQWAMNPDNNATTINDMPDAISNSWYDPDISDECTGLYKQTFDALEAAGIAVVFSAGNSGPGTSTITKPKNINTDEVNVFCVANIEGAAYLSGNMNPIASSSSRGPSTCGGTGSLLIKPEVSAPGTNVRSSVRNGGYDYYTGTSMACPHVVGAIALLKQAFPTLTGKQIKLALYNTAKDLGTAGEDNNYGKGLIDCYAAFLSMGTPDNVAPTTINDLAATNPTSNSLTLQWTAPSDTSVGGVVGYDVRMSTSPINDANFLTATNIVFANAPKPAGQTEMIDISNLAFNTTYYFAVKSRDVWGNWSEISNIANGTTLSAPLISVTPDSLYREMDNNQTAYDTLTIANISANPSTLNYQVDLVNATFPTKSISLNLIPKTLTSDRTYGSKEVDEMNNGLSIEGQGGPDAFGYKWIDSDAPNGPAFEWVDISTTGTQVTTWTPTGSFSGTDEGYAGPFDLGFNFKFYGNIFSSVYFSSNGFLSFAPLSSNSYTNATIPSSGAPNNYIAPYWDDLDGKTTGKVYYKAESDKFIVQYTDWPRYSGTGVLTFQVHLYRSGKIMFYYQTTSVATNNSMTVGIENATGTVGTLIAYNVVYAKPNLAVKISADPEWLSTNTANGVLAQNNSALLQLIYKTEDFPAGVYTMDVKITSNDPQNSQLLIPVKLKILEGAVPVELTSFTADVQKNGVLLNWITATETNNSGFAVERKMQGKAWEQIAFVNGKGNSTERSYYQYVDGNLSVGKYQYRLKQIDFNGNYDYSKVADAEIISPNEFSLEQNYPNPFNPSTFITYTLPEKVHVNLSVYNSLGELMVTLTEGMQEAGIYKVEFNASGFSSGTYIYRMTATGSNGVYTQSKKMILIK